jgi:RNA polymerase sigma-70 factor (family 1)
MDQKLPLLLHQVSSGDEQAFREVFNIFSPKIYLFALKLTRSKSLAEEVVQDVFLKIWDLRSSMTVIEHFPSYLYVVTRNNCFNTLKRIATEQKVKMALVKQNYYFHTDTEESVIYHDYQNLLRAIVEKLPPQQKLVYGLCHEEGLRYEEAATRLKISRLTVKTHMQQALRTIKTRFAHLLCFAIGLASIHL